MTFDIVIVLDTVVMRSCLIVLLFIYCTARRWFLSIDRI